MAIAERPSIGRPVARGHQQSASRRLLTPYPAPSQTANSKTGQLPRARRRGKDAAFEGAGWFHVTGITPAISATAADLALEAVRAAREKGIAVSCDLNYRKNVGTAATFHMRIRTSSRYHIPTLRAVSKCMTLRRHSAQSYTRSYVHHRNGALMPSARWSGNRGVASMEGRNRHVNFLQNWRAPQKKNHHS